MKLLHTSPLLALLSILVLMPLLSSCSTDEISPAREYPQINTLPVATITNTSITYQATLVSLGSTPVVEHGFVWNQTDDPRVTNSPKVLLGAATSTGDIKAEVTHTLERGRTYYVKAFIQTENYLVYGQARPFRLP